MPFTKEELASLFVGLSQEWINLLKVKLRPQLIAALTKLQKIDPQTICPKPSLVFEFARVCDLASAKVCLLGQDPYANRAQACGMAFSVPVGEKIPPSLINIAKCLGVTTAHGDLTRWAEQGVVLLNTALTTKIGVAGAHMDIWGDLITGIIAELDSRGVVFIALGNEASARAVAHVVYKWGHPSPLNSANKSDNPKHFKYCDCFSRTNEHLVSKGAAPIDWDWTRVMQSVPAALWLFTDGGASDNGKATCRAVAAWYIVPVDAVNVIPVLRPEDARSERLPAGGVVPTNQRAELTAFVRGLADVAAAVETHPPPGDTIMIVSDSRYAIFCVTVWYNQWVGKNKLGDKSNIDLIEQAVEIYLALSRKYTVKTIHFGSHQPRPKTLYDGFLWDGNNIVDQATRI